MDGLWTANFTGMQSSAQAGGGVVVFEDDKILGGDAGYYYTGDVETRDDEVHSRVRITPFVPSYPSVFGTIGREFTLILSGKRTGNVVEGSGYSVELPTAKFRFRLTRVA